ncbi:MAG TPA: class I SAM-dependent methyltransferase [Thermoplasmata archaeon]|nr:class I SAM-dependent methyltransferase [Thermoplasmata archaeon]
MDIGCGGTRYAFAPAIQGNDVVYADLEPRAQTEGRFVRCDAQRMPFRDACMTEVSASHVIEHVESPRLLLLECHRILEHGGILKLKTPNFLSENARKDPGHRHFFNFFTLDRLLKDCGFQRSFRLNIMTQFRPLELALSLLILPFLNELDVTAKRA